MFCPLFRSTFAKSAESLRVAAILKFGAKVVKSFDMTK